MPVKSFYHQKYVVSHAASAGLNVYFSFHKNKEAFYAKRRLKYKNKI